MNTVPRVFAYLRRYPSLALGTLSCAIAGTGMVVVFPAVTRRVIDEVLIQQHPERSDLYSHIHTPCGGSIIAQRRSDAERI
jgi:hypothetical protein